MCRSYFTLTLLLVALVLTSVQCDLQPAAIPERQHEVISITIPGKAPIRLDGQTIEGAKLEQQLRRLREVLTERQSQATADGVRLSAVITPKDNAPWSTVVEVFNVCVAAKIENIAFAPADGPNPEGPSTE